MALAWAPWTALLAHYGSALLARSARGDVDRDGSAARVDGGGDAPQLARDPQQGIGDGAAAVCPGALEEQVLQLPLVLVGTLEEIVAQVLAQRERYGFSYLTVLEPNMEAFAKVVEALQGR